MSHNVPKVWYFKCYNDVQVASVNTGTEIKKISEQWNADLDVRPRCSCNWTLQI